MGGCFLEVFGERRTKRVERSREKDRWIGGGENHAREDFLDFKLGAERAWGEGVNLLLSSPAKFPSLVTE